MNTTSKGSRKAFEGKVVLVTGANSGLGETAVEAFREAGATVFGIVRSQAALDRARSSHPGVRWVLADVSNPAQVKTAVEGIVKEAGRLDVVVNNAGVFTFAPLSDASVDSVRTQFEVNVFGATYVAQAALPALKESRGTILNISSAAGHKAAPGGSVYAATKAALESLTRSWALELAPLGIRVNSVAPGPTETPGFDKMGLPAHAVPTVKKAFVDQVPLGRMASSDEVVRWMVEMSDPGVTWVTGQVLSIDGGMSLT